MATPKAIFYFDCALLPDPPDGPQIFTVPGTAQRWEALTNGGAVSFAQLYDPGDVTTKTIRIQCIPVEEVTEIDVDIYCGRHTWMGQSFYVFETPWP